MIPLSILIPVPSEPGFIRDNQLSRRRVISILRQPNHVRLPKLHPTRPLNTFWFDVDNKVQRSVSDTIKAHFKEPHANWTQTPYYIRNKWFEDFVEKWHWDEAITEMVRDAFDTKAKKFLSRTMSYCKKKWKKKGDIAKPLYISDAVWRSLVQYWSDSHSESKVIRCSASRLNVDANGIEPPKHTSNQTSYAGRQLALVKDDQLPPVVDVLVTTHRQISRSDHNYNKVIEVVAESQSQFSQGGSSVQSEGVLSVAEMDHIYDEVAPKKRRRIYGIESIHDDASSSPVDQPILDIQTQLNEMNAEIAELRRQIKGFCDLFDIITVDNPVWAQAWKNLRAQLRSITTKKPSASNLACTKAINEDLSDDHIPPE